MPDELRRIEMTVTALGMDSDTGSTVIVLEGDDRSLAMVIGLAEATSIAKALEQVEVRRPLSHDLTERVIGALDARVRQVEIVDLRQGTYYAELVLEDVEGAVTRIDSRPSDAIAVALRVDAPIYVHEHVIGEEPSAAKEFPSPTDKEGWKKLLEDMEPEDFGKYKM